MSKVNIIFIASLFILLGCQGKQQYTKEQIVCDTNGEAKRASFTTTPSSVIKYSLDDIITCKTIADNKPLNGELSADRGINLIVTTFKNGFIEDIKFIGLDQAVLSKQMEKAFKEVMDGKKPKEPEKVYEKEPNTIFYYKDGKFEKILYKNGKSETKDEVNSRFSGVFTIQSDLNYLPLKRNGVEYMFGIDFKNPK